MNTEPDDAQPKIPPTVKGLALVSLFNDFAREMVYPLLPAFVVGTLGGSATTLGALDGAADLTAAVTKWMGGRLSDRPRWRKPLIVLGYFSAILIRPFMAVASAAWQVVGFRVLDRIGKGMRTPSRDALIADVTPASIRGRAYWLHRGADHFGSIPGSLLAWWLLSHKAFDARRVLTWSVVPGLVAGLVLLFVLRGPATRPAAAGNDARPVARVDATGRTFWGPVLALAALVLLRLPETLLLLRLQQLGVAASRIPLVWAGLHVMRTWVSYPGVWITDRVGTRGLFRMARARLRLIEHNAHRRLYREVRPARRPARWCATRPCPAARRRRGRGWRSGIPSWRGSRAGRGSPAF